MKVNVKGGLDWVLSEVIHKSRKILERMNFKLILLRKESQEQGDLFGRKTMVVFVRVNVSYEFLIETLIKNSKTV